MDNFNHSQQQPFYNSIQLTEPQWQDENNKALALQQTIHNLFLSNPTAMLSGWRIKNILSSKTSRRVNINSVRRSQTNLYNEDTLIKTKIMIMGEEGKTEHVYVLNSAENRLKYKEFVYKEGQATAGDIAIKMLSGGIQKELFD